MKKPKPPKSRIINFSNYKKNKEKESEESIIKHILKHAKSF